MRTIVSAKVLTPRNPTIAKVLYLRKAIEMWGRGIGLILAVCEKAHLAAPKIYEDRGFVYTVFMRPTAQEWQGKVGAADDVNRDVNHEVNVGTNRGTNGTKDGTKDCESWNNHAPAANNGNVRHDVNGTNNEVNREVNPDVNAVDHVAEQDVNRRILELLRNDPKCRIQDLAAGCGVSRATIDRLLKILKAQKRIRRIGGTRGVWEVC
jgi:predicted HTH transcriptional regulator